MIRIVRLAQATALAGVLALLSACSEGGDNDDARPAPGTDANLAALALEQVTLTPAFTPGTLAYTATVANSVSSTRVTPTAADPAATVRVNGTVVASGSASPPIALAEGPNTITTQVTAQNGTTTRTYTVAVTRRPPPGTNPALASIALTVAPLDQIFDPTITAYTASAGFLGTSTRVVAVPEDANASLALDGTVLPAGAPSDPVPLAVGSNTLSIVATAEDTVTTRTYEVDVTRRSLAAVRQEAYVKASNTDADDRFGTSAALSGELLVAGAPGEDSNATGIGHNQTDNSLSEAGAAYLYKRSGSDWSQAAYVKASNTDAFDRFGTAVAIDGDLLAVSATGEDSATNRINGDQADNTAASTGAVYAFERDDTGAWHQAAYLKASNAETGDQFGNALCVDEGRVLVGATREDSRATGVDGDEDDNSLSSSGAAYLFDRDGTGRWRQLAYLKASNTASLDEFGRSVAISGGVLAVGATGEDSNARGVDGNQNDNSVSEAGAVYLFEADTHGWSPAAYIKASNPRALDGFGAAVALDGMLLAVGAPGQNSGAAGIDGNEQDESMLNAGAVYLFERNAAGKWSQIAFIKASNPSVQDEFGSSIVLRGNLLAVGAPGQNSNAAGIDGNEQDESMLNAGAVYLFERNAAGKWSQIAYAKASNPDPGDQFGGVLGFDDPDNRFGGAIGFDGDTLAVGAALEDSGSTGVDHDKTDNSHGSAGAVYVIR